MSSKNNTNNITWSRVQEIDQELITLTEVARYLHKKLEQKQITKEDKKLSQDTQTQIQSLLNEKEFILEQLSLLACFR